MRVTRSQSVGVVDCPDHIQDKIHIKLKIMEVAKIPVVTGLLGFCWALPSLLLDWMNRSVVRLLPLEPCAIV